MRHFILNFLSCQLWCCEKLHLDNKEAKFSKRFLTCTVYRATEITCTCSNIQTNKITHTRIIHVCIHVHTNTHICIYIHTHYHTFAHIHIHTHNHTLAHIKTQTYAYTNTQSSEFSYKEVITHRIERIKN